MCREDLRLGKGRTFTTPITVADTPSSTAALPANAARVAIVMTPNVGTNGVCCGLSIVPNSPLPQFGMMGDTGGSIVFRIEDIGQALLGPLYPSGAGGGSSVNILEIVSNADAPPIP